MKFIFTGEEYGDRYAARTLLLNIQIIIEFCIVPENALFQKKKSIKAAGLSTVLHSIIKPSRL